MTITQLTTNPSTAALLADGTISVTAEAATQRVVPVPDSRFGGWFYACDCAGARHHGQCEHVTVARRFHADLLAALVAEGEALEASHIGMDDHGDGAVVAVADCPICTPRPALAARTPLQVRSLNAEIRAIEAGRNARAQGDGSFVVHSELRDVNYRVTFFGDGVGVVRFTCTCKFGEHNPGVAIGCKHMAAAGRSLVRRGLAAQDADGTFLVPGSTRPAPAPAADPFDAFETLRLVA